MADQQQSPVLAGAEMQSLERALDDQTQNTKKGAKEESKLVGWSPSPHTSDNDKALGETNEKMDNLNLGASAISNTNNAPATTDEKQLSKAELKKQRAAEFAKQNKIPQKKVKLSKAERRAQQEAQRAAKQGKPSSEAAKESAPTPSNTGVRMQYDDAKRMAKRSKASMVIRTRAQKEVALFSHLPQYERESSLTRNVGFSNRELHPAILSLGLKFAEGAIVGGNARCIAMLTAFQQVIQDYTPPQGKRLSLELDRALKPSIQYLIDCRPHSISMGNAIRSLRAWISSVSDPRLIRDQTDEDIRKDLMESIENYKQNRIVMALQAVAENAQSKLEDGDVILTYARSNVVEQVLLEAYQKRQLNLRVIVVDSRPHFEGKKLVAQLADAGLRVTYVHLNALSYVLPEVTKVVLGAAALMANGSAVARAGTALVALAAKDANVPCLVCCETYKFSSRVQLDAITHNELRDPDELVSSHAADRARNASRSTHTEGKTHVLSDWRDLPQLKLLNLAYDLTPMEYISMVVTELGLIPPTSVPAILREYSQEGLSDAPAA